MAASKALRFFDCLPSAVRLEKFTEAYHKRLLAARLSVTDTTPFFIGRHWLTIRNILNFNFFNDYLASLTEGAAAGVQNSGFV